jgi:hypothetical protein
MSLEFYIVDTCVLFLTTRYSYTHTYQYRNTSGFRG